MGPTLQRQRSSTNSRRTNSDPAAKLASLDSFKTGFTSETSAPELQSITSKEKVATQLLGQSILTSAKLMNESQSSYQVGLNMHSELCTNYNAELKNSLRKCILP